MARQFRSASDITTHFHSIFPRLASVQWKLRSPLDDNYQCIAWAACRSNRKWWPGTAYWPRGVTIDDNVDAFVEAFSTLGYERCSTRCFEIGYQKVAIYASGDRRVLHMARQHFWGHGWLSKCGDLEDIVHPDLECLEGDLSPILIAMGRSYGVVDTVLKRHWWSALWRLCVFRSIGAAITSLTRRLCHPSWRI